MKVHGYSQEFLSDKDTFDKVSNDLINFIKNKKIIIHNAPFDIGFLNGELSLAKKELINQELVIDSLDVARNKFPGMSNSLDALCKRFNIDLSRRTRHNALLDCELLREVYINLLDVKEPRFNLASNNIDQNIIKKKNYNKNIVEISEEEVLKHQSFIKKELKKNFY